ncbi:2-amino-4-hydroxy-6-hydroxymethyldihydropteridine diphosphokinase [Acinetobacter rudis]|uniref:2-amino-4-hydroxy-6- hydroxymethyldihydropteridine diphosphokinase n=1 Tax=Acinetobacter rudis TaxID=632955 RepID=UPI00280FFE85|nr:2-amino-4-hydroxy-6-hydroxymethyldihydropteridine diphosphokinase [Acinetobacter rudis]MDQ8952241.1 2-amino-4-hydroxy-6-hydroxymethyldihydropteridine diphosphokinase [Acinetobacter rudis]
MNATDMTYALALASNLQPDQHFRDVFAKLEQLGKVQYSPIYQIPCRDGVGADYWNAACILSCNLTPDQIQDMFKQWETLSGRVRPSHHISLDIDLIAWGMDLEHMQFNPKKMPLALDVKIPLAQLWPHTLFEHQAHTFPLMELHLETVDLVSA